MNNYCNKGKELLLDLKRSEWLPPYDEEGIRTIVQEMSEIYQLMEMTMNEYSDRGGADSLPVGVKVRLSYLQQCLDRNQLYINTFMAHRMEKIRDLRWEAGPVLPDRINQEILTVKEKEYFTKYNSILTDYIESIGFDVTADLEPPKDLLIEIRVLENCGEIMTENGPIRLDKNTIVFARRTDVESFIREGKVVHMSRDAEC